MTGLQHRDLAAGRWQALSLQEQLGNIGSEISRAARWMTKNPEIRFAKSIVDYIFRWLATKFMSPDAQYRAGVNIEAPTEASAATVSAISTARHTRSRWAATWAQ